MQMDLDFKQKVNPHKDIVIFVSGSEGRLAIYGAHLHSFTKIKRNCANYSLCPELYLIVCPQMYLFVCHEICPFVLICVQLLVLRNMDPSACPEIRPFVCPGTFPFLF